MSLEWLRNKQKSTLKVIFTWSEQLLYILDGLSLLNIMFYYLCFYFPIPYQVTYAAFLGHHCWVVKTSLIFSINEALPAVTIAFEIFFEICSFHHKGQIFPIITEIIYLSLFFLLICEKKTILCKFYPFVYVLI